MARRPTTLGRRMRAAVIASGMEYQEVAAKMHISPSALSHYVSSRKVPGAAALIRFVRATGCDAHWLLMDEPYPHRRDQEGALRVLDTIARKKAKKG